VRAGGGDLRGRADSDRVVEWHSGGSEKLAAFEYQQSDQPVATFRARPGGGGQLRTYGAHDQGCPGCRYNHRYDRDELVVLAVLVVIYRMYFDGSVPLYSL